MRQPSGNKVLQSGGVTELWVVTKEFMEICCSASPQCPMIISGVLYGHFFDFFPYFRENNIRIGVGPDGYDGDE